MTRATRAIFRYEVPVDDEFHHFDLSGEIVAVGCRQAGAVEFWAYRLEGGETVNVGLIVVGTGHELPPYTHHVGTAVAPGGSLVWHLMEHRIDGSRT